MILSVPTEILSEIVLQVDDIGTFHSLLLSCKLMSKIGKEHAMNKRVEFREEIEVENAKGKRHYYQLPNGNWDGISTQYDDKGTIIEQITFDNGVKHGKYINTFSSHSPISHLEGTFIQGSKNGVERWWYRNGQLVKELTYVQDRRDGPFTLWNEDGGLLEEGTFVQGFKDGLIKFYDITGKLVEESEYVFGLKNGLCKFYTDDKYSEITFVDGEQNGRGDIWYSNGEHALLYYLEGKIHGRFQLWYPDGQLKKHCTYHKGNKHGLYQSWNEDGTLIKEKYY